MKVFKYIWSLKLVYLALGLYLVQFAVPAFSEEQQKRKNEQAELTRYEKDQTFQGSVYYKDNNAWLISPAFAERMSMPAYMVSDALPTGIEALAIRYQRYFAEICSDASLTHCYLPANCYLDFYASPEARLPWLNNDTAHIDMDSPDNSWFYLRFNPQDFERVFAPRGLLLNWQTAKNTTDSSQVAQHLAGRVVEYEKQLFPELDYISTVFDCKILEQSQATLSISGKAQDSSPGLSIRLEPDYVQRAKIKVTEGQQQLPWPNKKNEQPKPVYQEADFRLKPQREALNQLKKHLKRQYTWAYTRAFAQRFQLPGQWVSDELNTGVDALVYRAQRFDNKTCGYMRIEDNCYWTSNSGRIDVFMQPQKIQHWYSPDIAHIKKGQLSASHYQLSRNQVDRAHWSPGRYFWGLSYTRVDKGWIFKRIKRNVHSVGTHYYQKQALGYDYMVMGGLLVYDHYEYVDSKINLYAGYTEEDKNQPYDHIFIPGEFLERVKGDLHNMPVKDNLVDDVLTIFGMQ